MCDTPRLVNKEVYLIKNNYKSDSKAGENREIINQTVRLAKIERL